MSSQKDMKEIEKKRELNMFEKRKLVKLKKRWSDFL